VSEPISILELRSVHGTGGGPDKTILAGARRLDERRFPTTVCYLRSESDSAFNIDQQARSAGVDYVEVRERWSFDWRVWVELRQLVRRRRVDIVHAHDYKTDLLALLLRREGVIPLATVHGWTGQTTRERLLYYPADKRILARFPRLIAVSDQIKGELVAAGSEPSRVVTVVNGIDHNLFRRQVTREPGIRAALGLAPQDVVIGAVGRLERQKRFDILIDVFAELRKTRPGLRLLIVGDGSLRPVLEAQAAALQLSESCLFLGHRPDIIDLHHAFQVAVQSSDYEGTPNVVLEAMAMQTPIVATDVGGTVEVARPELEALIVPPGDPVALRSAIEHCLTDQDGSRARVLRARRRVEDILSFDVRMSTIARVYEDLIESSQRGGVNAGQGR